MKKVAPFLLLLLIAVVQSGCNNDDSENRPLEKSTYELREVNGSGVKGTVTISENKDGSSTVEIVLFGSTTDEHPAFIYHGNSTGTGGVLISLNACTCATSTTIVTQLNSGSKLTYQGLKAINGHVKIHMSQADDTVVATGNIGVNAN